MSTHECFQFKESGNCRFGSSCRFFHDGQSTRASQRKETQVCYNVQKGGQCAYGDKCRYSHDVNASASESKKYNGAGESNDGDSRVVCFQFRDSGNCQYGSNCRYVHPGGEDTFGSRRKTKDVCYSFQKDQCRYGDACRFSHDLSNAVSSAPSGGNSSNACRQFTADGECSYGDTCRFAHA